MRSPRSLSLFLALVSFVPGCGGDAPAGGTQDDSSGDASTDGTSTSSGTSAALPTEGTGDTENIGTSTAEPGTSTSDVETSTAGDETSTSGASEATTDELGETSTTGEPDECAPRGASTSKPLTAPAAETWPRLFVRPDGYHLLYVSEELEHETRVVKLDRDGEVVGASSTVAPAAWRQIASSGERYAGATRDYGDPKSTGTITVAEVQPDDTLALVGAAELPSEGRGPSTIAVQWNPVAGEWGVLWQEEHDIDPNKPGIYHARLYFGRVSADGVWAPGSKKLLTTTDPDYSAKISDWANPLIWAGDRYAAVWAEEGPVTTDVYLAELGADGEPTRVSIDQGRFSRGVPVWDGVGYGVAWGHHTGEHYALRFAYVEGGVVGEHLLVGDGELYSNDATMVAVDGRFTVAWTETGEMGAYSRVFYTSIDPHILAAETVQVSEPDYVGTEWSRSLVHDGCRHALAFQHDLAPSDVWVRLFE